MQIFYNAMFLLFSALHRGDICTFKRRFVQQICWKVSVKIQIVNCSWGLGIDNDGTHSQFSQMKIMTKYEVKNGKYEITLVRSEQGRIKIVICGHVEKFFLHVFLIVLELKQWIPSSPSSDKYTRFCQWKNLELNIQVSHLHICCCR